MSKGDPKVAVELKKSWEDLADQERLTVTGTYLYGVRWIAPLARDLDVSAPFLNQVLHRHRALSKNQRLGIFHLCNVWLQDVERRTAALRLAREYFWDTATDLYRPDNLIPRKRKEDQRA